jgi:hypothetical protein
MHNVEFSADRRGRRQRSRACAFRVELAKSAWLIGLYSPELGTKVSRHKVDGGDLGKVFKI